MRIESVDTLVAEMEQFKADATELMRQFRAANISYEMARVQIVSVRKCSMGQATDLLKSFSIISGIRLEGTPE